MRQTIFGIDPGPEESAIVQLDDGWTVSSHETVVNAALVEFLSTVERNHTTLVIEEMQSYGMPIGRDVIQTVFWSGRFLQAWVHGTLIRSQPTWGLIARPTIKSALGCVASARDANVRQALIDRFGQSKKAAIGTKANQGPLYGVVGHQWSALAVAVAWFELHVKHGVLV